MTANLSIFVRHAIARARAAGYRTDVLSVFRLDQHLRVFGYRCYYCGGPDETIDHSVPLSRGGLDMLANLVPACGSCNYAKGARTPEEWRAATRIRLGSPPATAAAVDSWLESHGEPSEDITPAPHSRDTGSGAPRTHRGPATTHSDRPAPATPGQTTSGDAA